MSKRRQRSKLVDEPIEFGATRGDAAVDLSSVPFSSYRDIAGPAVLRQGVAVRYSSQADRLAVIPLGGRVLLGPDGLVDEETPYLFEPRDGPLQFGILGVDPPRDLDVVARPDGTGRVTVFEHPASRPLPSAPPVGGLRWSVPILEAVQAAAADGELSGFVVAGLVARFGEAPMSELLAGRDPVAAWLDRFTEDIDDAQASRAASLASALAIQWAVDWRRLDETMDPDDPRWLAELHGALALRDELASIVRVLRALDRAGAVDAILARADSEAAPWLASLPFSPPLEDPHLEEVARREGPFWASASWLSEP